MLQLQSNDAGEYLRLSRFQKDGESKKFSIRFPGGENRECWSMLAEVMETFLHKKPTNSVVSVQDVTSFPELQSSSKEAPRWGLVKISRKTPWSKIACIIKRKIKTFRYTELHEINMLSAIFDMDDNDWNRLWKPLIWTQNNIIIKVCKWFGCEDKDIGVIFNTKKEASQAKNNDREGKFAALTVIPVENYYKQVHWFKIKGFPSKLWNSKAMTKIGKETGDIHKISFFVKLFSGSDERTERC